MQQLACDLAIVARVGDCFALKGDLGAGKTSFARAFIRFLADDHTQSVEVPSPTFTLVQTYDLPLPVAHFDLYRIDDPGDVGELGLDECLIDGVALVEWPGNAGTALPAHAVLISFDEIDGQPDLRAITIDGPPHALDRFRQSLAIRQMLTKAGWGAAIRAPFGADASTRRYEVATLGGVRRFVMDAPRMPDGPPVRDGKPYSQLVHLAEEVGAFVAIAGLLRGRGFAAPHIHGHDLARGLVLIESLGDAVIIDGARRPIAERYHDAARVLAHIHRIDWPDMITVAPGHDHRIGHYDADVFRTEASLLIDWYVPWKSGTAIDTAARGRFFAVLDALHGALRDPDETLVLRDHHSPNIIWRDGADLKTRIGLIDFQDALIGPAAYDVMSLADDARVDVPDTLHHAIIAAYCAERHSLDPEFDESAFRRDCAIVTAQRCAKILGIFVRLDQRDGKPHYLAHLPRVERALHRALTHPVLAPLADWLAETGVL